MGGRERAEETKKIHNEETKKTKTNEAARSKPKSLFLRSSPFLRCESSWFSPWCALPYQPLSALSVILVTLVRSFEHVAILLAEHQGAMQPDRHRAIGEQRVVEPAQGILRAGVRLVVLAQLQNHQFPGAVQNV